MNVVSLPQDRSQASPPTPNVASEELLGGVVKDVLLVKEENLHAVQSSHSWWRACSPINPNGSTPVIARDIFAILSLVFGLSIDLFLFLVDVVDQHPQFLSSLADVACVAFMAFGFLGSVMDVVVGILAFIQGVRELKKNHKINGFRLFLEGLLTIFFGGYLARSFYMLIRLNNQEIGPSPDVPDLMSFLIAKLFAGVLAAHSIQVIFLMYGLISAATLYENIYRVMLIMKSSSPEAQLTAILSRNDSPGTVRNALCLFLGKEFKEKLHAEIQHQKSDESKTLEDLVAEQLIGAPHESARRSRYDSCKQRLEQIFHEKMSALEGEFGSNIAVEVFRLKAKLLASSSQEALEDYSSKNLKMLYKRWKSAQTKRLIKQIVSISVATITIFSPLIQPLSGMVNSGCCLLTIFNRVLVLYIDWEYEHERDIPVVAA